MADVSNEVAWDWDLIGNKIWWNQKYYTELGYKKGRGSTEPSSFRSGIFPDDRERVQGELSACFTSKTKWWASEFRFLTAKFTILHVFCRGAIFYDHDGNAVRFFGAMVDITNQKKAEERLERKNRELEDIYGYLQERTEKEKSSISYKMHEQLGQELVAIYQRLDLVVKNLEADGYGETGELLILRDQLQKSIDRVQDISSELFPEILVDIGIVETLEWYNQVFTAACGLEVLFMCEAEELYLSPEAGIIVYRIYRDLLNNISTHDASQVMVVVKEREDEFCMEIFDNGEKFMISEDFKMSVQYSAMKAAIASVHGSLNIDINWKEGTCIELRAPLNNI